MAHLPLQLMHPAPEQLVGTAGHLLVGTHPIETLHEQVTKEEGRDCVLPHGGGDLPARVGLVGLVQCDGDNRDVSEARLLEGLANQADVVGSPAPAAGLGDEHR